MKNITQNNKLSVFDYSILNNNERLTTLENEKKLNEIYNKYQPEVGEVLYNQQQVLANHKSGVFQQWYESVGFNRGNVYRYINKYKFLTNCEDIENKEIFLNMPISLQNEVAKPSSDKEINQKVFSGDITSLKEYRELEEEKKGLEERVGELTRRSDMALEDVLSLKKENEELKSKPAKVIEKIIEKEVIPKDYDKLRREVLDKQFAIEKLEIEKKSLEQKTELNKKNAERYTELKGQIETLTKQKNDLGRWLNSTTELSGLTVEVKNFFNSKFTPIKYSKAITEASQDETVKRNLKDILNIFQDWINEMNRYVADNEIEIIEVEVIE